MWRTRSLDWDSLIDIGGQFDAAVAKSGVLEGGRLSHLHKQYLGREEEFVRDILGKETWAGNVSLTSAQLSVMRAVFDHKRVAVYSGRGHGKDFTAALIATTWFYTRPSRVLCFAPSLRQLKTILFREISESINGARVRLEGEVLTMGVKVDASHWMAGIPAANPDNVRGFHAGVKVPGDPNSDEITDYDLEMIEKMVNGGNEASVLIICDEPEGLPEEIFRTLEGTLSKRNVHMLLIGNPIQSLTDEHTYPKSLLDDSGAWYKIKLSSFPEEKFPDPLSHLYDEVHDNPPGWLIPHESREKALRDYDIGDPIFLSDWLGRFSTEEVESQVVPYRVLTTSEERYVSNRSRMRLGPRIGIDIGFGGSDPCVAVLMVDGVVSAVDEWHPSADDPSSQITTAHYIRDLCIEWGAQVGEIYGESWDGSPIIGGRLSIDDSGLSGVGDILFSLGVECDRVNFAKSPDGHHKALTGTTRLANCRTEMYWIARMGLSDGMFFVPKEERFRKLRDQLPWTRYDRRHDGNFPVIALESKKDLKRRHGSSPDYADAFVLACRETNPSFIIAETGPLVLGRARGVKDDISSPARRSRLGWKKIL